MTDGMAYIDPASWPEETREALAHQAAGLGFHDGERVLALARLVETLRQEAEDAAQAGAYQPIMGIPEEDQAFLVDRVGAVAADLAAYLDQDVHVPEDIESAKAEYAAFVGAFVGYARAQVTVRVAYALLRALEVDPLGNARVRRAVMEGAQVGPSGEALVPDGISPQEWGVLRAAWICHHIADAGHQNLHPEERDYVQAMLARDAESDPVSEQELATLEYLLIRAQPNAPLFETARGRSQVVAYLREQARQSARSLLSSASLDPEESAFLHRVVAASDEDLEPHVCTAVAAVRVRCEGKGSLEQVG